MSGVTTELTLEPIKEFGALPDSFRNIRVYADEDCMRLHCIEAATIPAQKPDTRLDWLERDARRLIEETITGEIVEGKRALSLQFDNLVGWMGHDEGMFKLPFGLDTRNYPSSICRIVNSPWKAEALDYWVSMRSAAENLYHFRILSMTMIVDVLSGFPSSKWIDRSASDDPLTQDFFGGTQDA